MSTSHRLLSSTRHLLRCATLASWAGLLTGCSGNLIGNETLAPDRYYHAQPPGTDENRHVLMDKPEPVMYNQVHVDLLSKDSGTIKLPGDEDNDRHRESVTELSAESRELAHAAPSTQPLPQTSSSATSPTTDVASSADHVGPVHASVSPSSGTYAELGFVVCTVNDTPIFSDQILSRLNKVLAAAAKQYELDGFRTIARNEIQTQLSQAVTNELVYGSAAQKLDSKEKEMADNATIAWKNQQITANGGSLEQTRKRYELDGLDFDQACRDKRREMIVALYYEKKIKPLVQVTAQDIRQYYDRHFKDTFSTPEQVQFRVIKVSVKPAVSKDDARKKITDLRDRIVNKGEDFATVAGQFSDDSRLARKGGLEQPIDKGSYANEKLEQAAWAAPIGGVSDVIETSSAFYLVRTELKKAGSVRPFDDPQVQRQIQETLRLEQMRKLVEQDRRKLMAKRAMVPEDPDIERLVTIAMQNYREWRSASPTR